MILVNRRKVIELTERTSLYYKMLYMSLVHIFCLVIENKSIPIYQLRYKYLALVLTLVSALIIYLCGFMSLFS